MVTGRVYLLVQVLRASLHREPESQPTTEQLVRIFRQCQLRWRPQVCLRRYPAMLLADLNSIYGQEEMTLWDSKAIVTLSSVRIGYKPMPKTRLQDGFPRLCVRLSLERQASP